MRLVVLFLSLSALSCLSRSYAPSLENSGWSLAPDATTCVAVDEATLHGCVGGATDGSYIWVPDEAEINFVADGSEGQSILPIIRAPNVTIASNGGTIRVLISPQWDAGADGPYLIKVEGKPDSSVGETGDFFRLTGLNLIGPYPSRAGAVRVGAVAIEPFVKHSLTNNCESDGLVVTCDGLPLCDFAPCGVSIDNNNISGWSDATIWVAHSHALVADNVITKTHDSYGVLVEGPSDVDVVRNVFDHNWHDVTGDGHPLQRYSVVDNLFGPLGDPRAQRVDVHPYCSGASVSCQGEAASVMAGERYLVEGNYFSLTARQEFGCPGYGNYHAPIVIRGVPTQGAHIINNTFETSSEAHVWQYLCDPGQDSCVRSECPEADPEGISLNNNITKDYGYDG